MSKESFWRRAFLLYYDGFRQMTLGRTLWLIIGIKLFVMFAVLKVFFFPDYLKRHAGKGHEAEFVAGELTRRMESSPTNRLTAPEVWGEGGGGTTD